MKKTNNKGFSLVELIIVIAIMAVLVGVLAPQFIQYVNKSRISTDIQNIEEMVVACDTYSADHEDFGTSEKNDAIDITSGVVTLDSDVADEYGISASYTLKATWTGASVTFTDDDGWVRAGTATAKNVTYNLDGTTTD